MNSKYLNSKIFTKILLLMGALTTAFHSSNSVSSDPIFSGQTIKRKNITKEYKKEWDLSTPLPASIQNFRVLLVPGFLSDAIIEMGESVPKIKVTRLGEYFDEQMKWMSAHNIEFERIELPSQDSVVNNSKIISQAIENSSKPVIIIAHSKGGLDTLEALIQNPNLQSKVQAFIPIQVPFLGSPIADWVKKDIFLSSFSVDLLNKLGGTEESLNDLQTHLRKIYMERNKENIQSLVSKVNVISYSSYKDPELFKWDTLLKPSRDCMLENISEHNDGLVPWRYALLPGSRFIVERNVDHAVPVMHCVFLSFDRIKFMNTILNLALKPVKN